MKFEEKCYVWDNGNPVMPKLIGELTFKHNQYIFAYASPLVVFEKKFIPPIFGLTKQLIQKSDQLFHGIRDASPDYWGRSIIANQCNCEIEDLSEITVLLNSNSNRVGNLYFSRTDDVNELLYALSDTPSIDLQELEYAIYLIVENPKIRLNNHLSDLLKT